MDGLMSESMLTLLEALQRDLFLTEHTNFQWINNQPTVLESYIPFLQERFPGKTLTRKCYRVIKVRTGRDPAMAWSQQYTSESRKSPAVSLSETTPKARKTDNRFDSCQFDLSKHRALSTIRSRFVDQLVHHY